MKVLMVITSHDQLGNTGRKTGFWLEELAAPYYVFKDAGVDITLASPKGGRRRNHNRKSANAKDWSELFRIIPQDLRDSAAPSVETCNAPTAALT